MRAFQHINAGSVDEASAALSHGRAAAISGGTDLLGTLKDNVLPEYPDTVVNLKTIPGLDYIREEGGALRIGALARLSDIAENPRVAERYTALAQAAKAVATPHIRDMGTIGGSVAQLPRCWYFRKTNNRFDCMRKGGSECFAILGENRFHSAFGGAKLRPTPCSRECPAGTDIPGYFELLRQGDWDGAARLIMRANPMPMITSRVCAHPCQSGCNRCQTDEAVTVSAVERAVGDYILERMDAFYLPPEKESGKSVAVVGGGPSGLSAAYFLRRDGHRVTVYDTKDEPGGMLMYAIPAYRLPKDIVRKYVSALKRMGVEFVTGKKLGETLDAGELERSHDSVLIATGTWKRPVVGLSGEELTVFGLDFLVEVDQWMQGKLGADVIVTGGGNVAMDVAVTAKRLGAKSVTLACLEPRERMPASREEIERAEAEGVVVMPSWGLSRVVEDGGAVRGLELKRCVSPWDEKGAFNPQYDENEKTVVKAGNILMAIGQMADLSFIGEKYRLELTRRGLIEVEAETQMTSRAGVFASGDATTGPGTVIRSVANGRAAAGGISAWLGAARAAGAAEAKRLTVDAEGIKNTDALRLRELPAGERRLDLEDALSPSREEALREASRCMNCGCYAVHPSDIAPALVALDAVIVTNRREVAAQDFFAARIASCTVLEDGELVTEIRIPCPAPGAKSVFTKFAFRKAIDFPVVNVAIVTGTDAPRVCLGAVAPVPYRARGAEAVLAGRVIDEAAAQAAGEAAAQDAAPFAESRYKLQIAKTIIKRALLSMK